VDALDLAVDVPLRPVTEFPFPARPLAASDTETWRAINRIWKAGGRVWRDVAGDFHDQPAPNAVEIQRPRVGLYKSYVPNIDEGWTRWVLEQFGFDSTSLRNPDILAGGLRQRFDVIVFADQSERAIASGFGSRRMPGEYAGGLAGKGAAELKKFASEGGTLVFLNRATRFATEHLGLALNDVVQNVAAHDFYVPGALLRAISDQRNPVCLGVPGEIAVWSEHSPAWDIQEGSGARVVLRYPESDILASGWLLGGNRLAGKAAAIDYPLGRGRVILFGLRPQYRGQSYLTFKLLFNAMVTRERP
jgi:hypothetical protein